MDQQELTVRQFGPNAEYYLASEVHAKGAELDQIEAAARQRASRCALDLGSGAGHAAYALARGGAERVVAYDPSREMLDIVRREAGIRGYGAVEAIEGAAEALPFSDGCFDLIVTRYSAHHWGSVRRALNECARVLGAGGRLIVVDVVAPEVPLLDTSLQVLEFLRDASHVRNYRISEWREMQAAAGFTAPEFRTWKTAIQFPTWIARIGTAPDRVAALKAVFPVLPQEVRDYFEIAADFSFRFDTAWIEARRA